MIQVFENYIRKVIIAFIEENYPELQVVEPLPKGIKDSLLFRLSVSKNVTVFIQIQFVADRDYVIPYVKWSKDGQVPSDNCLTDWEMSDFEKDQSCLDRLQKASLSACEFGRVENYFDLEIETPKYERLKEIFESEGSATAIQDAGVDDWENDDLFHSWDMIDEILPGVINESDAKYVTSKLLMEIKELISSKYMPYINEFISRIR